MATLNAVILPAKVLKGGRHKIRISVAHNGETRYIVTDIIIDSLKEFKNGSIVKRPDAAMLNTKLRGIIQRYQGVLDELEYINGLTCPELVFQIKNAVIISTALSALSRRSILRTLVSRPNSKLLQVHMGSGIPSS